MAGDGFQDNVVLRTDTVLALYGNAFAIGSDTNYKSVIFSNSTDTEGHLAWKPTSNATAYIPDISNAFTLLASGQAIQGFGVSTGGNTSGTTGTVTGTVVLAGGNQITLSQATGASGATITISGRDAIFGAGVSTAGNTAGTTGTVTGTLVFAGLGEITLSQSTDANGATITISAQTDTAASVVSAIGVSTGGNTSGNTGTVTGTVVFEGINHITLSQSTAAGQATIRISGQDAIWAAGISTGGNTSGTSGTQTGTLVLAGIANITLSQATDTDGVTITISGPPSIAAAAGTQTATSGTVVWSNSNNISFGMSNSSVITAIAKNTLKLFSHNADWYSNWQIQPGFLSLAKFSMPMDISATDFLAVINHVGGAATVSNISNQITLSVGIYTFSGSTLSLSTSASQTYSWTSGSATTASTVYGGMSGTQYRTIPWNVTLTPGDYMLGFWFNATTRTGDFSIFGRQGMSIANALDANQTMLYLDGISTASFTTAMPASINLTNTAYNRTGVSALRQPGFILAGTF